MKRFLITFLLLAFCMAPFAQQAKVKKAHAKAKQTQTVSKKPAKQQAHARTKAQRKGATGRNTKKNAVKWQTTAEIKGLQSERSKLQKEIHDKEKELNAKKADVEKRLQNLVQLNTEIDNHQHSIDHIQADIKHLDGNIGILKGQLSSLEVQLGERKAKFIRSMRYMSRHRSIQDKLMFIFSAKNLTQMYRRLRFVREYAKYQRAQGELLQAKQAQVDNKHKQLETVRGNKNTLLYKNRQVHAQMETKKAEQQNVVNSLQQEQATLQGVIAERRKKQQALNAQIDRLIAVEIQKARARAAAEAKAQAAARAAAKRRYQEELARKRAAAAAAARENARRIQEAKEREARAREEARRAAETAERARREAAEREATARQQAEREAAQRAAAAAAAEKARAEQKAREAEAARVAAERKAAADRERQERAEAQAKKQQEMARMDLSSEDMRATGGFANQRGRLPMPLAGRIVSHFGQYNVQGLRNVQLSNSGISIKGAPGGAVHSVYAGEVSAVFGFSGTMVVMIRHGAYISVYCNLKSVSVGRGRKVGAYQTIGTVGNDGILQFQLRKETSKLNPEAWLR